MRGLQPPRRQLCAFATPLARTWKRNTSMDENLLDGAEELALEQNLLRRLGTEVSVRRLLVNEDTPELAQLRIDRRHLELDRTGANVELLVVLLEERLIVARGRTAALRIKEQAGAVRRHLEVARELEP